MYFLYFGGTKKAAPTKANKIRKAVFIRHCSGFGYIPYINLLNQTLTKTQQAPSLVQSSLAAAIAYPDIVLVFAGTALMQTGRAIEIISITMGTYLFLSLTISVLMNSYNKKMAIKEK